MKALTTLLAQRAVPEPPAEGLKLWRDAAQAQIDEPVIDACIFTRPTSYGANAVASHSGPIVGMVLRKSREIRAGGLPPHFILAVTDEEIVALRRTMKARGGPLGEPGEEVGRWRRDDLQAAWRAAGPLLNVTLTTRNGGQPVECCVTNGRLAESFLQLLSDPSRTEVATAA